jgi:diguanylate cyclase (GGDEF)-like protein/PAS domain S-box-containing protein
MHGVVSPAAGADSNHVNLRLRSRPPAPVRLPHAPFRSGEELFSTLAAHTPVGIFVSSAEGGCVYVNERWCELTGLSPEQAMGDGWAVAVHPDDSPRVNREWAEAAAHGRDSVVEYRFVRPDGSVSWVEGYAAALRDDDVRVIGWVGTCLDFTARKEAEERFRRAFVDAPIGMALLSPDGRWRQVNAALCELLGYSEAQLTRLSYADVTHPDDLEASAEHSRRQLDGEADQLRIEKRFVRRDGGVVWVALTSSLVRDTLGEPTYFVAQVEDVSERIAAESALQQAEEQFRRAFEDAPIGMALVGLDGRWLRVNAKLSELTGYSEEELLSRTWREITHPDDLDESADRISAVVDGRARSLHHEKRYLHADGSTVWVRVSSTIVRDAAGRPLHFVSQIEDIRDRRRAEDRLKELADHDPLTGLLNRRRFDEELRDTVLRLRRHGGRAALVLIDIDRFKAVNDTHGHKVGDDVLVGVAGALSGRLRATDVVGRLGGDEFAVLLFETGPEDSLRVAGQLAAAIRGRSVEGVSVTVSIGVVMLDAEGGLSEGEALVAADRALYRAKSEGRDRVSMA